MKDKKEKESQYMASALNNPILNYRVYEMKGSQKIMYSVLVIVAGGIIGLIFYGGLFKQDGAATLATHISNVVVFGIAGMITWKIFFPALQERFRQKRLRALKIQFRDFLTMVSNSLSSGANMNDAIMNAYQDLEQQYSQDAYMTIEVREILYGLQNGIPIEESLNNFGRRSGIEDVSNFATVFTTCYRTGGNIKEIVRRTTNVISEKMIISEEIETKLTSNKVQMYAMNVIPVVVVLMMRIMSSEFAAGFSSFLGVIAMTVAVAMFVAAFRMGEKIMDVRG